MLRIRNAPRLFAAGAVFLLLASVAARAQEAPLSTDRPGFGDGAGVMQPGQVQFEGGYAYMESGPVTLHNFGQALVRLGVLPRLEVRVGLNSFLVWKVVGESTSRFEDSLIGAKVGLLEGDGQPLGRPTLTLIVQASLPTGDDRVSAEAVQPEVKLAADWPLTDVLGLSANAGFSSLKTGDLRHTSYTLTLSLGAGLASVPGLGVYTGYRLDAVPKLDTTGHDLEGGATYLLNNDTQLDLNFGFNLHPVGSNAFFIGVGVAHRL